MICGSGRPTEPSVTTIGLETQFFLPGGGVVIQAGRFVFEVTTDVETFTGTPLSASELNALCGALS
jgi:hypothetical protein